MSISTAQHDGSPNSNPGADEVVSLEGKFEIFQDFLWFSPLPFMQFYFSSLNFIYSSFNSFDI